MTCKHNRFSTMALAIVAPILVSANADAGSLSRLTSDFLNFDGSETATNTTAVADCSVAPCSPGSPDGALFYRKKVRIPKGDNVLYVTFSGTADVHDNAALMMSCRTDGAFCNPGAQGASGGPAGWVTLQKLPFDEHDNSIKATWCIPLRKDDKWDYKDSKVTVDLKLASSTGGTVFFENAHIYVDSSHNKGKDRCQPVQIAELETTTAELKADTVRRHRD